MGAKKILLVDDSSSVLMMERLVLRDEPYEFIVARSGAEAIGRATADPPDLVLLDLVMPEMDGLETCRRLRALEATRDTPIIIISGRHESEQIDSAFESGCNDYLTKPISARELVEKVRSHLESSPID